MRVPRNAFLRSRRGVARPIFHKGEQVGEYRHYDERLTMFLLRSRRPQRYGKWIERMLAPDEVHEHDSDGYEDPAILLEGRLTDIDWQDDDDAASDDQEGADDERPERP